MDIEKMCRCCLDVVKHEIHDFTSEFALEDDNFVVISDCFEIVLNQKISEDEIEYSRICSSCLQQLRDAYIFQKKTNDSHDIFVQALEEIKQFKRDEEESQFLEQQFDENELVLSMENPNSDEEIVEESYVEYINFEAAPAPTVKLGKKKKFGVVKLQLKNGVEEKKSQIFTCEFCQKGFNVKSNLQKHLEIHSENRPTFECETCGQICKTLLSLQNHTICFHKPHLKIKCEYEGCEKSFADKSKLRVHQLYHKKEKNFTCTVCNQSYYKSSHLKRHVQNTHFKMRSYKCEYCTSDFVRKETFKTHIINQHKELGLELQNEVLEKIKSIREPRLDISAYTLERQEAYEGILDETEEYGVEESEIIYQQVINDDENSSNFDYK